MKGARILDRDTIKLTADGLPSGPHTLLLAVKDVSERSNRWKPPFESALQFEGFELPAGTRLEEPPTPAALHMTFLGDSMTQGVNILCPVPDSVCADGTLDYAWRVADAFGAGLEQVGFGAQGVTRGGGGEVPAAADALSFNFEGSPASLWAADVVVINQGTNDGGFGGDEQEIRQKYLEYLRAVRARYPGAFIVALEIFGTFGGTSTGVAGAAIDAAVKDFADPRTAFVSTGGWLLPSDYTESLHPNDSGHRKATERLIERITGLTGLQPVRAPTR